MNKGGVGEERKGKEIDGCPLTRVNISCSSVAMCWSAVNTLVDDVKTMLVATLV
jgi:hypothetical protein